MTAMVGPDFVQDYIIAGLWKSKQKEKIGRTTGGLNETVSGTFPCLRALAGSAQHLGLMQAGDAGDGGDHHTGEKLHGGDIALVEGSGRRGKHLEHA